MNRQTILVFIANLLLLQSCASTSEIEPQALEPLYFPPPPEQPRFVFERTLQSSAQLESTSTQGQLKNLLTGITESGTAMSKPFDVAVCNGIIFVSDTVLRTVLVFDIPSRRFFQIGKDSPGELQKPLGLDTDNECNLYVADGTARSIMVYDQGGQFIRAIAGQQWFDRLSHVAVNDEGSRVYAVDTGGVGSDLHHVRVFDVNSGAHLMDISKRGKQAGELNLPRDIEIDSAGNLYVVDGGNFRVQVFDQEGKFLSQIGQLGRRYGQFARPKGVATDADANVYVSDAAHGNFQIFDAQGQLLLFVGNRQEKFERASYMLPAGIAVDEDGRVYMIDQYFRKLDIFRPVTLKESEGFLGIWSSYSQAK